MTWHRTSRIGGWIAVAAFAFAVALGAAPKLHESLHADAAVASHQCAVTLISSGNCEHSAPSHNVVPALPLEFARALAIRHAPFVPACFLDASIFEHAPPALS